MTKWLAKYLLTKQERREEEEWSNNQNIGLDW